MTERSIVLPFVPDAQTLAHDFNGAILQFHSSSASRVTAGAAGFLNLQPAISAAGAIGGAQALRHDALAAERAGVLVDDCAAAGVVLIERDAPVRMAHELGQDALAFLDGRVPQVRAVQFE
jgi:hypothetical protein